MKNKTIEIANTINEMIAKFGSNLKITCYDVDTYSFEREQEESYEYNDVLKAVTSTFTQVETSVDVFDEKDISVKYESRKTWQDVRVSLVKKDVAPHPIIFLCDKIEKVLLDVNDITLIIREVYKNGYKVSFTEIKFSA